MGQPKVIIYMSCYNHEKYVKQSLDSIVNQTYKNWELYVVNDGSTDNTGKIIETYKDTRIHYYDFKENTAFIGAANFLQNLILKIDGKYIATSSSDDMWELDKLQKQVEVLETHPEYKCCFTWDKIILEDANDTYKDAQEYSHKKNRSRYEWIKHFFYHGNCINACSMLMDKHVFYELGRMNENFRQIGDYRLWIYLAVKYPFYMLEEEKTYYRRHGTNLSKASVQTIVRSSNEFYETYIELFKEMDQKTFERVFYSELPYVQIESEEEYLAAKFILLLNTHERAQEQVAISLYLENCENETFLSVLENKYGFKASDFIDLSGNGGMAYLMLDAQKGERVSDYGRNEFTPAYVLLNIMESENARWEDICRCRYSTLIWLGAILNWNETFSLVKQKIETIRRNVSAQKEKKCVVIMIGEKSRITWDEIRQIMHEKAEYYLATVPTRQTMFKVGKNDYKSISYEQDNTVKVLSLYDEKQHCLKFLDEVNVKPDVIYYVDCMDERYPCVGMSAWYSLEVEQNAVLTKDIEEETGDQQWRMLMTDMYWI